MWKSGIPTSLLLIINIGKKQRPGIKVSKQDYIATVSDPNITKNIDNARLENIIDALSLVFNFCLGESESLASSFVPNVI